MKNITVHIMLNLFPPLDSWNNCFSTPTGFRLINYIAHTSLIEYTITLLPLPINTKLFKGNGPKINGKSNPKGSQNETKMASQIEDLYLIFEEKLIM